MAMFTSLNRFASWQPRTQDCCVADAQKHQRRFIKPLPARLCNQLLCIWVLGSRSFSSNMPWFFDVHAFVCIRCDAQRTNHGVVMRTLCSMTDALRMYNENAHVVYTHFRVCLFRSPAIPANLSCSRNSSLLYAGCLYRAGSEFPSQ